MIFFFFLKSGKVTNSEKVEWAEDVFAVKKSGKSGDKPPDLTKWKAKKRKAANDSLMQPSKVAREMTKEEVRKYVSHCNEAKRVELEAWKGTKTYRSEVFNEELHKNTVTGRWVMAWKSVQEIDIPKWEKDLRYDSSAQRRAKARYVLRGFQDSQIDSDKEKYRTDSPTGSRLSFHAVVAVAVQKGWKLKSCDISTAFLQGVPFGELGENDDRAVQVVPPVEAGELPNVVWALYKPAYGISDAPRRWHESLSTESTRSGARTTSLEHAVRKWNSGVKGGNDRADGKCKDADGYVVEHVDDLVYARNDKLYDEYLNPLKKQFPFGSEDDAVVGFKYTGCIVKQESGTGPVELDQTKYIREIRQVEVPTGVKLDDVLEWRFQAAYRSLLGAVAWSSLRTRPDLACSCSHAAKSSGKATLQCLLNLNKLARRAFGTSAIKLRFSKLPTDSKRRILVLSDANWGRENAQKSQGGYWILLSEDRDSTGEGITVIPLSWRSWCLRRVALSTLCAETQAAVEAVNAAVHIRKFMCWILGGEEKELPIDLRSDCESLINALRTTHSVENPRTNVQVQSIRGDLGDGTVRNARHISGKVNPSDIFTKGHDLVTRAIVYKLMEQGKVRGVR